MQTNIPIVMSEEEDKHIQRVMSIIAGGDKVRKHDNGVI